MTAPFLAWRQSPNGVVVHAVWTDGTNRALGRSLCGIDPDRWYYASGRSLGFATNRCNRCKALALQDSDTGEAAP